MSVLRRSSSAAVSPAGPAPIMIAFLAIKPCLHFTFTQSKTTARAVLPSSVRTACRLLVTTTPSLYLSRFTPAGDDASLMPAAERTEVSFAQRLRAHLAIARLDHSIKNL